MELSYLGTFVPGNESSRVGTFEPVNERKFHGTFVPWNFLSFPGTNVTNSGLWSLMLLAELAWTDLEVDLAEPSYKFWFRVGCWEPSIIRVPTVVVNYDKSRQLLPRSSLFQPQIHQTLLIKCLRRMCKKMCPERHTRRLLTEIPHG